MNKAEKYDELNIFLIALGEVLESVEFSGLEGDKKVTYGKLSVMSTIFDKLDELEQ